MPNTPDIDVSALAEALNEKMDRDMYNKATNIHYIVETWHSGTEWYRVWSDGWIEQGGTHQENASPSTITFNKAFSDTEYTILTSVEYATACFIATPSAKTTTTCKYYQAGGGGFSASSNKMTRWYACGF